MSITKPYKRLWRPFKGYEPLVLLNEEDDQLVPKINYLNDERFVCQGEKHSLLTTAHLIVRDLYELFNYIEPHNNNISVFSHRIYELFLRTSTEFESNCKGILKDNGYSKPENKMCINDYFNIAQVAKLSDYVVTFERWTPHHEFKPFESWNSTTYAPLDWYQSYNYVKQNRYSCFHQANLGNLMKAIAGLICILHAQFGEDMAEVCFERVSDIQVKQD